MFQGWRRKLREAEEACRQGRLEEASRLLIAENLREFLPGQRLAARVADAAARRACRMALEGDFSAAWKSLDGARRLIGDTASLTATQRELLTIAERQVERHLELGKPAAALELLRPLLQRPGADSRLGELEEVARRLQSAANLAARGRFGDAASQMDAARLLRPELETLSELQQQYESKADQCGRLLEALHRAIGDERWTDVVQTADRLVALAPQHPLARDAHRRAWAKVGAPLAASQITARSVQSVGPESFAVSDHSRVTEDGVGPADRFLVWIDAVGGYLVCLSPEITIGQATPGSRVDIPIQADISRLHAKLRRAGEGYVVEAIQAVRVNGRAVDGTALLRDGDEIQLGEAVRMKFRQPHALSASAGLEIVSRHRMQPNADGVLLMAESCVLGPSAQNHVVCRQWSGDLVLYRQDDQLFCRALESVEIDGQYCDGRAAVGCNSRIVGGDFSLSLEAIA